MGRERGKDETVRTKKTRSVSSPVDGRRADHLRRFVLPSAAAVDERTVTAIRQNAQ